MPLTPRQRAILEKADVCRDKRKDFTRALRLVDNTESYLPPRVVHEAEDAWHKAEVDLLQSVQEDD